jgi:hypothetical protein
VVITGFTIIERRIVPAIQNLKACLDIAISIKDIKVKTIFLPIQIQLFIYG